MLLKNDFLFFGRFCLLLFLLTCNFPGGSALNAQDHITHYREQEVHFTYNGDTLFGKLITPGVFKGKLPVIVFVHGSGPEDYSSSGNYRYLWEVFTKMGFACYSWNRPGVAPSGGKWFQMSVADRAREVVEAIRRVKKMKEVDSLRLGLWGISQAGWVIPEVAGIMAPAFVITVSSPVTTAFRQEGYRVRAEMRADGLARKEQRQAAAYNRKLRKMIKTGRAYQQFSELQNKTGHEKWSGYVIRGDEMVYDYLSVVFKEDHPPDIDRLRCPVLAIWGANDLAVPPRKSARVYRKALKRAGNSNVLVRIIPDADHTLTFNRTGKRAETIKRREQYSKSPAAVFAPGYIQLMTDWLAGLELE
ncbi:alpha/beta hydrolase family protein [Niabella drilacis]|uniref:AB hydrolase-1 domain-containing protein n=1 Tax=Niabella drilacis (strain DSM 25811 / CCM 8410 / CCUG 62505 / LMG 26954 / E90) TaxID=1285928 RepID=A0A1G6HZD4_NIADE|nr:alpha/beta hydrolase [Niabella drilacis]SDB99503.1 hypothetical protein SAMN04487894_10133 [Niabella drilacis]